MDDLIEPSARADNIVKILTLLCSACIGIILLAILISLIQQSIPSMHKFGLSFIYSADWNPPLNKFGALSAIIGTLITSLIALLISIPLSYGIAISATNILPKKLGLILSRLIELMSGIPSIIYGMWGLFVFGPFLMNYIETPIYNALQNVPGSLEILGFYPLSTSIFTASIILGIMIIPIMSTIMIDTMNSVSPLLMEAGYGLGTTKTQAIRSILIPKVKSGLYGAITMGLGRAIGETMAVTLVIGNSHNLFNGLFMSGTTISATIANEFNEATGKYYTSSLLYLALVLFVLTFSVLWLSQYFKARSRKKHG